MPRIAPLEEQARAHTGRLTGLQALALVAAAAILAFSGGCGDGGQADTNPLATVAHETVRAGTAQLSITVRAPAGQGALSIDEEGVVDFVDNVGRSVTVGSAGGHTEVRQFAEEFYVRPTIVPPVLASLLGGDRHWIKADAETRARLLGPAAAELEPLVKPHPTVVLAYLDAIKGTPRRSGRGTVRGVSTIRYAIEVNLDKVTGIPGFHLEAVRRASRLLGGRPLPVEAWVDSNGRIRRISFPIDLSQLDPHSEQSLAGTVRTTIDLYGFGIDVDVEKPTPSEVLDLGELVGRR